MKLSDGRKDKQWGTYQRSLGYSAVITAAWNISPMGEEARPAVTQRSVTRPLVQPCSLARHCEPPPGGLHHPPANHSPKERLLTCNPPGRGPQPLLHPPCSHAAGCSAAIPLTACGPAGHGFPWEGLTSLPPTPALQGTLGAER